MAAAVARLTVEKDGLRAELDSVNSLNEAGRATLVIERDAAKRELADERKRTFINNVVNVIDFIFTTGRLYGR